MLPDRERLDQLFAADKVDEEEIVDLAEYESYAPVLVCAAVMVFIVACIILATLSVLNAPKWMGAAILLLCSTLPFVGLMIWSWNKPAILLPSGTVMQCQTMRLYIGLACVVEILVILLQMLI